MISVQRLSWLVMVACAPACTFAVRALDVPDQPGDLAGARDLPPPAMEDLSGQPPDFAVPPDLTMVTGMLMSERGTYAVIVDLSAEGAIDWMHWGRSTVLDVDRKAGTNKNYIGASLGSVTRFGSYTTSMLWVDGTPTASATTTSGVYAGSVGDRFTFTVPASQTTRTLSLYLIIDRGTSKITASLSDGSAMAYTDTVTNNSGVTRLRYTFTHRSAQPSQTLNVTFELTGGSGTIDLQGATYY
jgi:hypothetical protein